MRTGGLPGAWEEQINGHLHAVVHSCGAHPQIMLDISSNDETAQKVSPIVVTYWDAQRQGKDKVAGLMLYESCCEGCVACYLML